MYPGGFSPLMIAAKNNNPDMFDFLLGLIKSEDLRRKQIALTDNDGNTIAHFAAQNDNPYLLNQFFNLGGNISAVNREGKKPVHQAIAHDQVNVIPSFAAWGELLISFKTPLDTNHPIGQAIKSRAHKVLALLMTSYNMRFKTSLLEADLISSLSPRVFVVLLENTKGSILDKIKLLTNFIPCPSGALISPEVSLKIDLVSDFLKKRIESNPELLIYYTFLNPNATKGVIQTLLTEKNHQLLKELLKKIIKLEDQHPAFEIAKYYLTEHLMSPKAQQPLFSNSSQRFLKGEVKYTSASHLTEDSIIARINLSAREICIFATSKNLKKLCEFFYSELKNNNINCQTEITERYDDFKKMDSQVFIIKIKNDEDMAIFMKILSALGIKKIEEIEQPRLKI